MLKLLQREDLVCLKILLDLEYQLKSASSICKCQIVSNIS